MTVQGCNNERRKRIKTRYFILARLAVEKPHIE
jgi:hypothetical protein